MISKKYYKVVNKKLQSSQTPLWVYKNDKFILQYQILEWTKPKIDGTSIMVFDDLKEAKKFKEHSNGRIFECEVENPKNIGIWRFSCLGMEKFIALILKLKKQKKKYLHLIHKYGMPKNTVFCSSIKLTKEIL